MKRRPPPVRIVTERFGPTVGVTGVCVKGCTWSQVADSQAVGHTVRQAARYHASTRRHVVMVHVERLSSVEYRPEDAA